MKSKIALIREFFGCTGSDAIREFKALTAKDKDELGSAIARSAGLTQEQVDFPMVEY